MFWRKGVWAFVLFVVFTAANGFSEDNFLPGDKAEVILGSPDKTGVQIVKAGTSIILKGECKDAMTKFTIWRLQQQFGNITDLTVLNLDAAKNLKEIEKSFSSDLSLSFNQDEKSKVANDLRFKIVEGRLVVSGYANNKEDIAKIEKIAKIYDKNPVINVEMRKDMIEIDAIFCRIQRTDGSTFGTRGLQSVKLELPVVGYNFTGKSSSSSSDALNNDGGTYTSIDHRVSASMGDKTSALSNALTANFGVTKDDIKILVRPSLSTLNGQEAVFHSGGQQPFTIINQQAQNVEWKDYGTKMTIKPTLTTDGKIEVEVNIELTIPLNDADKRFTKFSHNGRAILNENEALVLSGLVQQIYSMNIERTPFLGKIPILNFFFGIQEKNHDQEELAVVVMPRRPSTANERVTGTMKSTKEMQNIIIETAPSMGPVPENQKNSRPVKEK
ncbi:MAG: hypothetical protein WCU00_08040 [Candidatus Latescibacterota bacterium]